MAFALLPVSGLCRIQVPEPIESFTLRYKQATPDDAVSRLQHRIDRGELTLARDGARGYLPAVLKALHVPTSSQMLVFSKTSVQKDLISPSNPRALYFNDSVTIGYVPGGPVLEAAAIDPKLGIVYYNLLQKPAAKPRFFRNVEPCLECHLDKTTDHIPVHILESVYPDADGTPEPGAPIYATTDQTPLVHRWGGWYVTGTHGSQRHMGNSFADRRGESVTMNRERGANRTDLHGLFDPSLYPRPTSDIVALMVMEHQAHLQNLILRARAETSAVIGSPQQPGQALAPSIDQSTARAALSRACEPLVKSMLFAGEARLTAPVAGTTSFAWEVAALPPFDHRHRSLRQLDLKHRLMRYPCSYTIYSEAFDALPERARDYVFRRLRQILNGDDTSPDFAHLSAADRRAIRGILLDTKPAFAAFVRKRTR
jgi:hypothetical protein